MTPLGPEVEVLLGLAGTYRRVPMASISAITRVPLPTLRESCSRLLLSFFDQNDGSFTKPEGEPTEGENGSDGSVQSGSVPTVTVPQENKTEPTGTLPREPTVPNVPTDPGARGAPEEGASPTTLTAETLADALDDRTNLPFYRTLIATVAPTTLAHALEETLARRHALRGRPGGYFTAVVRRLTNTPSYARTSPNTP